MTIPINPGDMQGGAVRGRRDPTLVRQLPPPGAAAPPPAPPAALPVAEPVDGERYLPDGLTVDHRGNVVPQTSVPDDNEGPYYMIPGDKSGGSITLAWDFGTGGTTFLRWETETTHQDGDTDQDVYIRVAGECLDKLDRLIDDTADLVNRKEAQRVAAAQAAGIPT